MPRANRYYTPGYVWHITHRCHNREFLFQFDLDRKNYLKWLYKAKDRYNLIVLDYMVTSNHVHLILLDNTGRDEISRSIQLAAGRTAQEYNQRKDRKGAFWEDRYHATAIESEQHLMQCMIYVDMNMVRAKGVKHPADWPYCGYREIIAPKRKFALIDRVALTEKLGLGEMSLLPATYREQVEAALQGELVKEEKWTESLAIGSKAFAEKIKIELGKKVKRREVIDDGGIYCLREGRVGYHNKNEAKKVEIGSKNRLFWDVFPGKL